MQESRLFRSIFFIFSLVVIILLPFLSFNAGVSADEGRHYEQAKKVYNYFGSLGEDKAAIKSTGVDPMHYNGQFFDNAMYAFEQWFGINNRFQLRHFFNALIGAFIILFVGLFLRDLSGYRAGVIGMFLLFVTPFFLGHSYNNNKDIPFALGFIMGLYGIFRFYREFPRPSPRTLTIVVLGIAFAISIRIAGVLLYAYMGLFGLIYLFQKYKANIFTSKGMKEIRSLIAYGVIIALVSFVLGIIFWPFMLESPVDHLFEVLGAFSKHPISLSQLFEGKIYPSTALPENYVMKYIFLTYPTLIFVGLGLLLFHLVTKWKKVSFLNAFIVIFSFSFILIWMITQNSNIYGGIRHLLFAFPPIVVAAGWGINEAFKRLPKKSFHYGFGGILLLLSLHPLLHIFKNHPHEYVYYNELSGGVKAAHGFFETDYFQHSIRAASEWVAEDIKMNNPSGITSVFSNDGQVRYFFSEFGESVNAQYTRYYEKYSKDWDYGIFYSGYISPHQLQNGFWPPANTVHTIDVSGIPICAIVKRTDKNDFLGFEAEKANNISSAKNFFKAHLQNNPDNDQVLERMANIYYTGGQSDSAEYYIDQVLRVRADSPNASDLKGRMLLNKGQYDQAIAVYQQLVSARASYYPAYYFMALAYLNKGDYNNAIRNGNICLQYSPSFKQAYQVVGDAYARAGDQNNANAYYQRMNQIK